MSDASTQLISAEELKKQGFVVTDTVVSGINFRIIVPEKKEHLNATLELAQDMTEHSNVRHIAAVSVQAAMEIIVGRIKQIKAKIEKSKE